MEGETPDLSSDCVHCDYGTEAYFGEGTKLTVLGKDVLLLMSERLLLRWLRPL